VACHGEPEPKMNDPLAAPNALKFLLLFLFHLGGIE
jgi:hypothetical protein